VKDATISFKNFSFRYFSRDKPAVSNLNFSISKGEFIVITGVSGSGKSTICYSILGLLENFYEGEKLGEMLLKGIEISNVQYTKLSKIIGYIPQRLENSFTTPYVFSEIAFPLEYKDYTREEIVKKVHSVVGDLNIEKIIGRKLNELSEGEKQLVAIGTAIVDNPEIIVADEPLANLDQNNKKLILDTFIQLNKKGKTIIIATHEYEEYLQFASKIIRIERGEITDENLVAKVSAIVRKKPNKISRTEDDGEKTNQQVKMSIENLSFDFSDKFQLSSISLKINKGKIVALVGDNGSGKTTLLKLLIGLLKPKQGSIKLDNIDLKSLSWTEKTKRIGVVFQDPDKQFFEETSIDEILLISNNIRKEIISEDVDIMVKNSGLSELIQFNPHSLSHGEKRRLSFLSAIQHQPEVIILDEITNGLDDKNKSWIKKQIVNMKKNGTTVIIISHDWRWVGEIADEFIGLENGQISFTGPKNQFETKLSKKNFTKSIKG